MYTPIPEFPTRCARMLGHIAEVICAGDADLTAWHLAWLAQMVQEPQELPHACVSLDDAEQGSGIGAYAAILSALVEPVNFLYADTRTLSGHFNGSLRDKRVVFVDEDVRLDRVARLTLASLLRDRSIMIERPHAEPVQAENLARLVIVGAPTDDPVFQTYTRRHVLSSHRRGDAAYFNALHAEITDADAADALRDYLLSFDHFTHSLPF